MAFPLLPPLKKDGDGLDPVPITGTWAQVPTVALNNIAENLAVTKIDAKFIDIDSIPSMWARPLLFEIALYDEEHPMHECVVDEWRGLLAMLALKEQQKFPLETKSITIPDGDGGKTPEFLQALRKLLPQRTLDEGTAWDKLYLILFKDNPIGMTSPTTLVCTAVDYTDLISDVPWFNGQVLCDPIPDLNEGEKTSVAGWLNDFHKNTITLLPDSPIKGNLAPRILDFITDLGGTPDGQPKLADTPLGMSVGIFTGMNLPIAPKEYFTEKLFVIPRADAFKENVLLPTGGDALKDVDGESVTPILPIAKELLSDFSIDALSKRITFKTTPVGIEVSLQLPSPDGGPDFSISRVYVNQKDGDTPIFDKHEIVEIPNLPVLEIWPNFRTPDWKVYYTYFNKAQQDTFYVDPFLTDGRPEDVKITKTSAFPEAMICKYRDPKAANPEDAGFLFIKAPPVTVLDGAKTWNVGIDFGTSSTTVYRTELPDGGPSAPVTLRDRLLQITDSGDLRSLVQDDFLSNQDEETPLFSLFQENSIGIPPDDRIKPLLDGRIYFVDDPTLPENVISNLKWSDDPVDRKRTQAYLEQICLQSAAEAAAGGVSKVNWHFSYPIAFSAGDRADFKTICEAAANDISETGFQTGGVNLETESVVTGRFFGGKFGGFADGAVCIDIGGETSDISIWQNNTLCWQTSIRFAGRHIFLDLLKHKPNFLRDVGVTETGIPALHNPNDFYSQADTLIDASINNSPKDLKAKFGIYGGKIKATPFVPLIGLGISGLFYYVGLILNYLSRETEFRKTMPNIYIGGNGSRILHWLANGEFKPDNYSCGHLKDILLTASGFDPKSLFDLEITPKPKHEAAAGLVDAGTILKSTERQFDFLAGEDFTENGENKVWTELLKAERLGNGLRSGDKLVKIETFIEKFNAGLGKALGQSVYFDGTLRHKLAGNLNSGLQNLAFTDPGKRIVEPLFILLLKNLLKRETETWK